MAKNNNVRPTGSNQPQPGQEIVEQVRPTTIDNGEDVRGGETARENQTRTQPEPTGTAAAIGDNPDTLAKLATLRPIGGKKSLLAKHFNAESETVKAKQAHTQEVRQYLAEASDLYASGGMSSKAAREVANKAAILLYQDRSNGLLSNEEMNGILGDIFGYRGKGDKKDERMSAGHPEAGKTPFGEGEAIRKRIVRFVQARAYVDDKEASTFFENVDKTKVAQILNNVENESLPIWTAYEKLAEIKREGSTGRVNPAYDPKAIEKIVTALATVEGVERFAQNEMLQRAYGNLLNMIRVVDEQAAELLDKAA